MQNLDELRAIRGQQLRSQLLQAITAAGITGLGLGAVSRGAGGAATALTQQLKPHSSFTPDATLPVEVEVERDKVANQTATGGPAAAAAGNYAKSLLQLPYALPALAVALGGGTLAGWKGTDAVIDGIRQQQLDSETAKVKARYLKAISPQPEEKQASATPMTTLDSLYAMYASCQEKSADGSGDGFLARFRRYLAEPAATGPALTNPDNTVGPLGAATGLLGTLALGAAVPSSVIGYYLARRRGANNVVAKARRQYESSIQQQRPSPVAAVPRLGENDD